MGGLTVDNIQIDPGMVAATAAPSGLQGTADNTLEGSHTSASPCIISEASEGRSTANPTDTIALPNTLAGSHTSASPCIVSESRSMANPTDTIALPVPRISVSN